VALVPDKDHLSSFVGKGFGDALSFFYPVAGGINNF
jgi:hypothetical protein